MRTGIVIGVAALACAPASSTVYQLNWTGAVTGTNLNTAASNISVGDAVSSSFVFDDSSATTGSTSLAPATMLYNVNLSAYTIAVGAYSWSTASLAATYFIEDNWYGEDGLGFDTSIGTLSTIDFEAVTMNDVFSNTSLANGMPLGRLPDQRITAVIGSGSSRENIFATMHATVSVLSAIPEPATWTMMIGGFGFVGAAMRRRKVAAATLA